VIFCSGKVFFDIQDKLEKKLKKGESNYKTLVIRVEELAPFPVSLIE
jgi:2-oxoglutarate dehydrogenase complex dehydrogenase (E1) component-like enzyme